MKLKDNNTKNRICFLISVAAFFTVVLLWYIVSWTNPDIMPTPIETVKRIPGMIFNPSNGISLLEHIWASFRRVIIAYFSATVFAVALGVSFGWNKTLHDLLGPIFEILRPIPPIAWIPLLVIWFGIGESSKIAVVFIGAFVPVLINTYSGMIHMDPIYEKAGKILGANRKEMFLEIVLPASFPSILAGMKTALSQSWACVMAAEMIASQRGLGYMIVRSMESGDMGNIMISLVFISGISALLSYLFSKLEAVICPW